MRNFVERRNFVGHDTFVNWFKSSDAAKNYRKVAEQMGGARMLYGDNFAVECAKADCKAMKDKVGGEVA